MDKEAFASVVLSSTDSLYRISKSILKSDADCEDAVQEAIARALTSWVPCVRKRMPGHG